jgi:hypothetical protein
MCRTKKENSKQQHVSREIKIPLTSFFHQSYLRNLPTFAYFSIRFVGHSALILNSVDVTDVLWRAQTCAVFIKHNEKNS